MLILDEHVESYTLTTKIVSVSPKPQCLWSPNLAWCDLLEKLSPKRSQKPLHNCMVTKLGDMVIYLERLQPIKSYDSLIMWSREIT